MYHAPSDNISNPSDSIWSLFSVSDFLYAHTSPSFNIFLMFKKNNVAATVTEMKSETGSAKKRQILYLQRNAAGYKSAESAG